jgi:hypothetical protein
MAEHEVRERYQRTQMMGERVEAFLASPEVNFPAPRFFDSPTCGSHYVVTPLMIQDRIDFAGADKRRWLEANPYPDVGWQWVPFQNGVRVPLIERQSGASKHRSYRDFIQLYRCGAISHWSETAGWDEGEEVFLIASLSELQKVQDLLLYAGKILNLAGYSGPVRIQGRIRSSKPKLKLAVGRWKDEYPTLLAPDGMVRVFVESPSSDVLNVPNAVLRRVADDMFRAFGRWDASWFFDDNGNLRSP